MRGAKSRRDVYPFSCPSEIARNNKSSAHLNLAKVFRSLFLSRVSLFSRYKRLIGTRGGREERGRRRRRRREDAEMCLQRDIFLVFPLALCPGFTGMDAPPTPAPLVLLPRVPFVYENPGPFPPSRVVALSLSSCSVALFPSPSELARSLSLSLTLEKKDLSCIFFFRKPSARAPTHRRTPPPRTHASRDTRARERETRRGTFFSRRSLSLSRGDDFSRCQCCVSARRVIRWQFPSLSVTIARAYISTYIYYLYI